MNEPNNSEAFQAMKAMLQEERLKENQEKFDSLRAYLAQEDKKPKGEPMADRILKHLRAHPDASLRDLRALGKSENVTAALKELEANGSISKHAGGAGKASKFVVSAQ